MSCPVPKQQRPINEYVELVQSNFFNWPILNKSLYKKKISKIAILCFIFSLPLSSLFFNFSQSLSRFLIGNCIITSILLGLLMIRLLLGWAYIKQRLYKPTIFYEESGWYDGRIWVKPKNILVQDRLIRAYQVLPAIKKLKNTLILLASLFFSLSVLLLLS